MFVPDNLLRRHVHESNLIEGISAAPGDALYDGHMVAARAAATGMSEPNQLHQLITRNIRGMRNSAGVYRTSTVVIESRRVITRAGTTVGVGPITRYPLPRQSEVSGLMEKWRELVGQFSSSQEDIEEKAFLLHAWLLCIHPWRDGNGRTARLVWNMLRVSKGLPWHIESVRTKQRYYARIRSVERVFTSHYGGEIY